MADSEAVKDYEGRTCYLRRCPGCGRSFSTYDPRREYCHDCAP